MTNDSTSRRHDKWKSRIVTMELLKKLFFSREIIRKGNKHEKTRFDACGFSSVPRLDPALQATILVSVGIVISVQSFSAQSCPPIIIKKMWYLLNTANLSSINVPGGDFPLGLSVASGLAGG
jgi:hypothetical protein